MLIYKFLYKMISLGERLWRRQKKTPDFRQGLLFTGQFPVQTGILPILERPFLSRMDRMTIP